MNNDPLAAAIINWSHRFTNDYTELDWLLVHLARNQPHRPNSRKVVPFRPLTDEERRRYERLKGLAVALIRQGKTYAKIRQAMEMEAGRK